MSLVRSLLWIFPIGAAVSVTAALALSPTPYRIFRPGPVTANGNDPFELTGSFSVAPDPVALPPETSHGSGGACIFGDLAKHGAPELSCTNNSQCTAAWSTYYQANLSNPAFDAPAFGFDGNGACIANRCWYRPATGVRACDRRPTVWPVGNHKFGPYRLDHVARMYGRDSKIDWQVVTCANRAQATGADDTSCRTSAGIYHPGADGPARGQETDAE